MFTKGQLVRRIVGGDGCLPSVGSEAIVDTVVDRELFTLEGYSDVRFIMDQFEVVKETPRVHQGTSVDSVIQALETINNWNKVCPSSQLISIEGHIAVDGGSVFLLGGNFDTNNPTEMYAQLIHEVNVGQFQAQLSQLNVMAGKVL